MDLRNKKMIINVGPKREIKQNKSYMGKHSTAEEELIKKGPWTAEEDEVLINFVKKNGPRDWSSIRSMGLLPRTGKSCRLRWVNKLRPNLKRGCKFSAEEERLVLDLQARFGNKWATIASYLQGRTDNDVKNFWSTRQKRLARILKSSAQASRPKKNKGKAIIEEDEAPVLLAPESSFSQVKEEPSIQYHQSCSCFSFEPADTSKMVPPQLCLHPNIYTSMPQFETTQNVTHTSAPVPPLQCSFTELPPPESDLPLLPESYNLCLELIEPSFMDVFPSQEVFEIGNVPELYPDLPFEDLEDCNDDLDHGGVNKDEHLASPIKDSFNDFPADMLDYLDAIPKSSAK